MSARSRFGIGISVTIVAVVLAIAAWFLLPRGGIVADRAHVPEPPRTVASDGSRNGERSDRVAQAFVESPPSVRASDGSVNLLRGYGSEATDVASDLAQVDGVLQRFWLLFKNPDILSVGSNRELMASLLGDNPEGLEFVSPNSEHIDGEGQLLDRWGQPLHFHAISITNIEIRSSGPDREMFTDDDALKRSVSSLNIDYGTPIRR